MSLKASFTSLKTRLSGLCEQMTDLRLTLQEDHPSDYEPALIDLLSDAGEALLASFEEALDAAIRGQALTRIKPADLSDVCRALLACNGGVQRANKNAQALLSFERRSQLVTLGQERGKAWRAWSKTALRHMERLEQSLLEVSDDILEAWRELSERLLDRGVSIQATNIGQQVQIPADQRDIYNQSVKEAV